MSRRMLRSGACAVLLLANTLSWAGSAPESAPVLETQEVRPGLHVVSGTGGNVAVWSGADGTVLVDDGVAARAPELLATVEKIAPGRVRVVMNTHWHPDHTGGNAEFARNGSVVVAHENVRVRMGETQSSAESDFEVPAAPTDALPVVTFDDTLTLHLNGDRLTALHVDAAHTDGDLLVWWEDANVVHVGDIYYAGAYPFLDLDSGGSLAGLVAALETVLSRADARTVVIPGHGPVADRAALAEYRDMLVAVGRRVRELVEAGKSLEEVLAARPTAAHDERYGQDSSAVARFVAVLYRDLARGR